MTDKNDNVISLVHTNNNKEEESVVEENPADVMDNLFERAKGKFTEGLIIGYDEDGQPGMYSPMMNVAEIYLMLSRFQNDVLNMDFESEEPE